MLFPKKSELIDFNIHANPNSTTPLYFSNVRIKSDSMLMLTTFSPFPPRPSAQQPSLSPADSFVIQMAGAAR